MIPQYNFLDRKLFLNLNLPQVPVLGNEVTKENSDVKTTTKKQLVFTGVIGNRFRTLAGPSEVRGFLMTRFGCTRKEQLLLKFCARILFLGFFAHDAACATPKLENERAQTAFCRDKHPIASGFLFKCRNASDLARRLPLRVSPRNRGSWHRCRQFVTCWSLNCEQDLTTSLTL